MVMGERGYGRLGRGEVRGEVKGEVRGEVRV